MIKLIKKYKEIGFYLLFGILTTLINIISYYIFSHVIKLGVVISSILSWITSVLFAYFTNRKWVFHSNIDNKKEIFKEITSFFSFRLLSGIIDLLIMFIFVNIFHFDDLIIKIISNIIVIILNYIFSKLIIFNKNNNKKDIFKILGIGIFLFILTFFMLLESPINPFEKGIIHIDQGVFETIGMMMRKGFMPYRDTFDHKGPLIYLYNYIGLFIEYYKGIWYLEFINLLITLIFLYKIARLKLNRGFSILLVLISSLTFFAFFNEGNMTEEFALPFISISLYIFLDYILNNNVNKFRLFLCGISFGGVLLLRPNMIALWIVFGIYIFIKCIKEKKYGDLRKFILYFLIGLLIIILPFIIWLSLNNSLKVFFEDYIIFNFKYSKLSVDNKGFIAKVGAFFFFESHVLVLLSIIILIILFLKERKNIYIIYLIYIILSLLLISMSGNTFPHYGLVLMPISIFPLTMLLSNKKIYKFIGISLVIILSIILLPNYIENIMLLFNNSKRQIPNNIIEIVNEIKNNSDEHDSISVYGNINVFYVLSERKHATKYSYTYPISNVNPNIKEEYFKNLQEEMPKFIITYPLREDEEIMEFINNNNYKLNYSSSLNNDYSFKLYKLSS